MDTGAAIDRVELLLPIVDTSIKPLLEHVIMEAKKMLVIRQLCAGDIIIDDGEEE